MTTESLAEAITKMADRPTEYFDRRNTLATAKEEFHWQKVTERFLAVVKGNEPELEKWLTQDLDLMK